MILNSLSISFKAEVEDFSLQNEITGCNKKKAKGINMMRKLILINLLLLMLFSVSNSDEISDYYKGCEGLKDEDLKLALHDIIKGHKVFPYFDDNGIGVSEMMEEVDIDPENPDNIICFYSGFSYPKNWIDKGRNKDYESVGTTQDNSWNREHVWAKSHGFPDMENDIAYSDIHNLRPEDRTVNTSKGAKDFDWGGFPEGEVENCFTDEDSWEAPDRVKGDIARCLFYMAVRYEGTDTPYDLEIVDYTNTDDEYYGRLSTMLEWHKLDPPDDYEKRRNNIIFEKYQQNRNPFIDHPEYAFLIWGEPKYDSRMTLSQDTAYFSAIEGQQSQLLEVNLTAVNYEDDIKIIIADNPELFRVLKPEDMILNNSGDYINNVFGIEFSPVKEGKYNARVHFTGYDNEMELNAFILPKNGNWLVNESFDESLSEFDQLVLQGNKRYGWHQSSWDEDEFARVRGTHGDFEARECWLISPELSHFDYKKLYLNFRTARSSKKSDQLSVYLAYELPVDGIPASAVELSPQLSEGNYDWTDSGWLVIDSDQYKKDEGLYLLFRYYYDGHEEGQETWQVDDLKLYGTD